MRSISQEQVKGRSNPGTINRKQRTKRGQAGLEMMAFIAFIMIAFSIAYIAISSKTIAAMESKSNEDARWISDRVASEINAAIAEGQGYSKTFKLPDNIQNSNYTITIERGTVFVDWQGKSVASNVIVNNITGNFTYGWNTVENFGGIIFAN